MNMYSNSREEMTDELKTSLTAGLTEAEDEDLDALRAYLEAVGDQLGIGLS